MELVFGPKKVAVLTGWLYYQDSLKAGVPLCYVIVAVLDRIFSVFVGGHGNIHWTWLHVRASLRWSALFSESDELIQCINYNYDHY